MGKVARFDGSDLLRLRKALGWTLQEMSEAVHLSRPYLCQIEKGVERLSPSLRLRLWRSVRSAEYYPNAEVDEALHILLGNVSPPVGS